MSARVNGRPAQASVFDGTTDACQQLLGLFGSERMRSVIGSCLELGQMDFASLEHLQTSDPAAFDVAFGAADDLLTWARQVQCVVEQVVIRVFCAKADWE